MTNQKLCGFALSVIFLAVSSKALALAPTTLSGLSNSMVDDMIRTTAAGTDYRSMTSAAPMGTTGFDLGVDVVALTPPDTFMSAVSTIAGVSTSQIPSPVPVPRLSIRKGLPLNLNVGLSFMPQVTYQGNTFQMWGGEVLWSFLSKPLAPTLALRFTANYSNLWFLDSHSYRAELVGSKSFGVLEPFFTLGYQVWNGSLSLPITLSTQLPTYNLTGASNGSNLALGLGAQFKLVFLKFALEYNYYFTGTGIQTFGGRLAVLSF